MALSITQLRELCNSKHRKRMPGHLPKCLDYLPAPELTFDWGYGHFSPHSLRSHIHPPPPQPEERSPSPAITEPTKPKPRRTKRSVVQRRTPAYTLPPGPYDPSEPEQPLQALIGQAILSSYDRCLSLREISDYICTVYPFYEINFGRDADGNQDSGWTKRLWRKLSSSYFVTLPRGKEGRALNLYTIDDKDLACFEDGGFVKREAKKRAGKPLERSVSRKKRRVSDTPDLPEEEDLPFPAVPSMSRSPTESVSPPPERTIPPRRPFHLSSSQPLRPSSSLSALPQPAPKRLVPVHSWHEPAAYRTVLSKEDMHNSTH